MTNSSVFIDESGRAISFVFINQSGPLISMTRSKHLVFIEQTKLDVANPFSFSFSFSSVVRIDEGNEGNEESHLTHYMLSPAL